jgi:SAM-dependent methyltransferase
MATHGADRAGPVYAEGGIRSLLLDFAQVKPHERVLDIGCGGGRWAVKLAGYLSDEGGYDGFDVSARLIERCRKRFGPEHRNFNFHLVDVYNRHYNPEGKTQVRDFRFPFEDETFDVAILYSVFTHMLPDDVEQYVAEILRVLRRGGRVLASYLLVTANTLELLDRPADASNSSFVSRNGSFRHDYGVYRATNPDVHEAALAYREDFVLGLYDRLGLRLTHPIQYGDWRTQVEQPLHQDLIVAVKY